MYGQLKFPILSNQNHSVIVSGEIHITDHETITHTIPGVKSIEIDEADGSGKIYFKGGFTSVKVCVISVKDSDKIIAVNVGDFDAVEGSIEFECVEIAADPITGVVTKSGATEECELALIAVIATAG
jgi:hypothetical protein